MKNGKKVLETEKGKDAALTALEERRANKPERINNSALPAGAPMYFYCISCGHMSEVCPENYTWQPARFCKQCAALKELGWLE